MIILPKQIGTEEGEVIFQESEEIKDFKEAKEIIVSLKETLEHYGGVGLAAPQVGIPKRIFVVDIKPNERYSEKYPDLANIGFVAYINPVLTLSSETNIGTEGCLSVIYGSLFGQVERANSLKIEYLDLDGKQKIDEIKDPFHARVIQHEYDHLNRKIFLQRMNPEDFTTLLWEEEKDIRKKD